VKVKDGSGHQVLGAEKERERDIKDALSLYEEGREAKEKEGKTVDPYVEVSLHVPEWTYCVSPSIPSSSTISLPTTMTPIPSNPPDPIRFTTTPTKTHTSRTPTIKNNGFNPIWNHMIQIPFDAPTQPGMLDLIFLRLLVKQESSGGVGPYSPDAETLAVCCVSLGEVREGYRHLPLYDATLSQYLFSTLFVKVNVV
jgi:phosphatidylinositol phospholipase C delta